MDIQGEYAVTINGTRLFILKCKVMSRTVDDYKRDEKRSHMSTSTSSKWRAFRAQVHCELHSISGISAIQFILQYDN